MKSARGLSCVLVLLVIAAPASAQKRPEAKDMTLLGYDDLQGRSAYQPTIHAQGGRWIAYIGHHGGTEAEPKPLNPLIGEREFNGTSLVDVTDPHHPKYLAHIPGEEGLYEAGGAQMVRVCDGRTLQDAAFVGAIAEIDPIAGRARRDRAVQLRRDGTARTRLLAGQAEIADQRARWRFRPTTSTSTTAATSTSSTAPIRGCTSWR